MLAKEGYEPAIQGITTAAIDATADGMIAGEDDTPAGTKRLAIRVANAENSLAQNNELLNIFISICGAQRQNESNKFQVTWGEV